MLNSSVGFTDGIFEGCLLCTSLGEKDGELDGIFDGNKLGREDGVWLRKIDGCNVG